MRKINIKEVTEPGNTNFIKYNMYSVYLGNSTRNLFSNRKDALKFIADTNRFLNLKLHEFNSLLTNVQNLNQKCWFYFDETKIEGQINNNFEMINRAMVLMVTRSGHSNGNHFVFKHFFNALEFIKEIINLLINLLQARRHYLDIYQLQIFNSQAVKINYELAGYGKNDGNTRLTENNFNNDGAAGETGKNDDMISEMEFLN